jgi:hypothetical protein
MRLIALSILCSTLLVRTGLAQTKTDTQEIAWTDIRMLNVEGRGWNEPEALFDRLPAKAEKVVPPPAWTLSRHSAGMLVRFVTGATRIHARWAVTSVKP